MRKNLFVNKIMSTNSIAPLPPYVPEVLLSLPLTPREFSLLNDLPDYPLLEIMRQLDDIRLMQICMSNKRMRRLCGYKDVIPAETEGIYDLTLKARLDKYITKLDLDDSILLHDINGYYPIVTSNIGHMRFFMENLPGYNEHLFFIKRKDGKYLIGQMGLHTGSGYFFSGYAPDLKTFYESTFTGVSNNKGGSDNIIKHFLQNGYTGVIGCVKDNSIKYISEMSNQEYTQFKRVLEYYKN
jgi:hypothetical protein